MVALLLSAASAIGLTRLRPDARVDLLIDPQSNAFRDQALFADTFGADPVVIMAEPAAGKALITPDHMVGLSHLEGKLHTAGGVKRVYGPGTLVNTLAISTTTVLLNVCAQEGKNAETGARAQAAAAGKSQADQDQAAQQAFQQAVAACAQRYAQAFPSLGVPAVNNPTFLAGVLLEPDGQHVRPFWTWALPDLTHAILTVRLNRDASLSQVVHLIDIVNGATTSNDLKELHDLRFTVTGSPALTLSVADSVFNSLRFLLPLALLAMLIVGLLALRLPMLLTLPVATLAALWTAGVAGFVGLPITPATLAVLPVVLGLATDYFIQSVNRVMESEASIEERVATAARRTLPSIGLAAVATGAGMLAFVSSPIPLVKQFGFFMALGVAMAYLANYLVGLPSMLLLGRFWPAALSGTGIRQSAAARITSIGRLPFPAAVAVVILGLGGLLTLPGQRIETDPAQLVGSGDPALAQAEAVKNQVGLAGEIDLVLQGDDPTTTEALTWLDQQTRSSAGQSAGDLKALESLPAFLKGFNQGALPDAARTKLILDRIPSYFSGAVFDRSRGLAISIFGLTRVTSVDRDHALVSQLQAAAPAPSGYRSFPAGLAVIADQALTELQGDQLKLTALAIILILLVLLIAYRRPVPALLAVLPTVVAAGAASALLFATGRVFDHRSSPITILLAGVVVAFATEFGVLWLARYRVERALGADPATAATTASSRVGPAIVASALALVAGFAVLGLSPVPTVRDFGLWSAFDMALATVAVLTLMPPMVRTWLR
ncbi:MAG TPA: MMPL family transporter [Candidatus Dormibacteraeota bacterium]